MSIKNISKLTFKPSVDPEKCNGCEDCIEACTAEVLAMRHRKAMILNADACQGCEGCVAVCREGAIRIEETGIALSSTCQALLKDIL